MHPRTPAILILLAALGAGEALAQAQAAPPFPPRRPAELGASPVEAVPAAAPAPPMRLGPAAGPAPPPAPSAVLPPPPGLSPAAAPAQTAAVTPGAPITQENAVDRVNAYLNSFTTLVGDFVQIGADGRRYTGKLYVHRPGRLRFEYNPPATIQVIADGTTVVVRDRRLATQDPYLIGQTPLKFLLKERIDLKRDVTVTRVAVTPEAVRVTVEDRATLGGTSRITLNYDPKANVLRQWIIVDPQGHETNVQVANLDTSRVPDPALFRINLERVLGGGNN
jgi:outer membrane lipoprotein-sorting protein